jgi:hypothetical protein
MSMLAAFRRRLLRSVPMSIMAILVGAVVLTPAIGGAATFLTKRQGNKLFLGNTADVTTSQTFASNTGGQMTVLCPAGRQATGGGANSPALVTGGGSPTTALMLTLESAPVTSEGRSVGWTVEVFGATSAPGGSLTITAHAVCSK